MAAFWFAVTLRDDFQLFGSISAEDACHGGSLDAFHSVRIGHDNALDVFDDVVADADFHEVRLAAQHLAGLWPHRAMAMGSVQPIAGISSSFRV